MLNDLCIVCYFYVVFEGCVLDDEEVWIVVNLVLGLFCSWIDLIE